MTDIANITGSGWDVVVRPALGGAIARAAWRGRDILRPTSTGAVDPRDCGCFPLVPFANRIAARRFTFDGVEYRLSGTIEDEPHSLHGVGWLSHWTVADELPDRLTLHHDHPGDHRWPWAYRAIQRISVADDGLSISLSVTNAGPMPMPAGVGLHPYFPVDPGTRLTFNSRGLWLSDDTNLPSELVDADRLGDWAVGDGVVHGTLVDNVYEGWDGRAELAGTGLRTTLTSDAGAVHLFIPPGEGYACIEPVSHLPDAINRGGMTVLRPGETLWISMRIASD